MSYDRSGHPPDRPDLEFMADVIDAMTERMRRNELTPPQAVLGCMTALARLCAVLGMRDFDVLVAQLRPLFESCVGEAVELAGAGGDDRVQSGPSMLGGAPRVMTTEEVVGEAVGYRPGRVKARVLELLGGLGVKIGAPGRPAERVGEEAQAELRGRAHGIWRMWRDFSLGEDVDPKLWQAQVTCTICKERLVDTSADRDAVIVAIKDRMREHAVTHIDAEELRQRAADSAKLKAAGEQKWTVSRPRFMTSLSQWVTSAICNQCHERVAVRGDDRDRAVSQLEEKMVAHDQGHLAALTKSGMA